MNQFAKRVVVALALCLVIVQSVAIAQNLGAAPQVNVAVQGQTGAQPEVAFLNFVNGIGNQVGRPVSWGTGPPNSQTGVMNGGSTTRTRRNPISAGAGCSSLSGSARPSWYCAATRGNDFVLGGRRRNFEVDVLGHRDDHPPTGIRMVCFLGRRRAASRRRHWQRVDVRVRE